MTAHLLVHFLEAQQQHLDGITVLVFIDQQVLKTALQLLQQVCILRHNIVCLQQTILEAFQQ